MIVVEMSHQLLWTDCHRALIVDNRLSNQSRDIEPSRLAGDEVFLQDVWWSQVSLE